MPHNLAARRTCPIDPAGMDKVLLSRRRQESQSRL
jgi:hypothetical protein